MNSYLKQLATTYDDGLSGVFSEDVDIAKSLQERIMNAMRNGENISEWEAADVERCLGLGKLTKDSQGSIAEYVKMITPMLPKESAKSFETVEPPEVSLFVALLGNQFGEAFTGIDFLPFINPITTSLFTAFENLNLSGIGSKISEKFNISDDTFIKGFQAAGKKAGKSVTEEAAKGMLEDTKALMESCNTLRNKTDGYLKSAFTGGFNAVARVRVRFITK